MLKLEKSVNENGIEWTDWSEAVPVKDTTVKNFVEDLANMPEAELCDSRYSYMCTGDTLVMRLITRDIDGIEQSEEFFEFRIRRLGKRKSRDVR